MSIPEHHGKRRTARDLKLVAAAAFLLYTGFGVYVATFMNFAVEVIHIRPEQLGILESLRESPGFLMALVLALAMHIAEPVLGSAAMVLMILGFLGYTRTTTFTPLVLYSVLGSVGLHVWMPLQSAMILALADEGEKGRRLGQVGACAGLGMIVGMGSVLLVGGAFPYSVWYAIASGWIATAAVTIWFVRRDLSPPDKPRLVLKHWYRLYYFLTFLEGCRKQVFITFAPYVLVRVFKTPLQTMAFLMLVNNVVNLIGAPIVGRMIDRIGERRILTTSYTGLVFVFLGYAFVPRAWALYVLFCMDNLLYLSSYGLTTYLSRTADERDMVPSLSMGVTMNHLAAVIVPLAGGVSWAAYGYQLPFIGGAGVVLISLAVARRLGPARPKSA